MDAEQLAYLNSCPPGDRHEVIVEIGACRTVYVKDRRIERAAVVPSFRTQGPALPLPTFTITTPYGSPPPSEPLPFGTVICESGGETLLHRGPVPEPVPFPNASGPCEIALLSESCG